MKLNMKLSRKKLGDREMEAVRKESGRRRIQSPAGKVCLEKRKDISPIKTHWGEIETVREGERK